MKLLKMITFILFACIYTANSQALSAYEVMKLNYEQTVSENEYFNITMVLTNKRGNTRKRQLEQFSKINTDDNRSTIIKFLSPADIGGTGFLAIENKNRDDDQWLYLPAFKKTRRISGSNKSDYFVGSDITFEDLSREDLEDCDYSFLSQEVEIDGVKCYHILALPKTEKKKKESGYGKRELFIRKDNHVIIKANFYDAKNALIKEFVAEDIKQVGDKWRAHKIEVTNIKNSHKTTLVYNEIATDKQIDEQMFTERFLVK